MEGKINLDLKTLKFIYEKYKKYLLSLMMLLASFLLIFQFVIPQFGILVKRQQGLGNEKIKLEIYKKNLEILRNVNGEVLDSQVQILTTALPINKDFIALLNLIYFTAQKTGADLGNFSFKIGDILETENSEALPVIKISVPVNSGIDSMNSFVEQMSESLPLAEVTSVRIGGATSGIDLSFYYKPLNLSDFDLEKPVKTISQSGLNLVNNLKKFDMSNPVLAELVSRDASDSAQ